MLGLYLALIRHQGDEGVAVWFVVGLAAAALLSIYGIARRAPGRRLALIVSGVVMVLLGIAGLLTIGLPVILAGVIALVAASRAGTSVPRSAA
jgi:hypothetical protein